VGDGTLTAFWISFPKDPAFPKGLGVTGWSRADVYRLLEENGYDFHLRAREVCVREGITIDEIDQSHVRPNAGPMIVRGMVPVLERRFWRAKSDERTLSRLTRRCRRTGASVAALPLAPTAERQYRWADEMVSRSLE
jgi:hypothetical protein